MVNTGHIAQTARFRFGENWRSYSALIGDDRIAEAENSLKRLLQREDLAGVRFLDIGCGSGLFSLAARNLGASVHSFDFDREAVDCTRAVKTRFRTDDPEWSIEQGSILDIDYVRRLGTFDIVYAWGVLHHTGDMRRPIENAAGLVDAGGVLALALYRKTPLCGFWAAEKHLYSSAPRPIQAAFRATFNAAFLLGIAATGRNPISYVRNFKRSRGMSFNHDTHDWLGGYPYQSATPDEVARFLSESGFRIERKFDKPAAAMGIFGSHCDEYVARESAGCS